MDKPTILIVDDEERMRRVIADYLRIKNYHTVEAADGVEAMEQFRAVRPSLVLLDVMMPRMNGWDVCRAIRQTDTTTPIILLTARSEESDELQGFERKFFKNMMAGKVAEKLYRLYEFAGKK